MHRVMRFFCRSPLTRRIEVDAEAFDQVGADVLVQTACGHGLEPLLYAVLRDAQLLSRLAPEVEASLQAGYRQTASLCALRLRELRELDQSCEPPAPLGSC